MTKHERQVAMDHARQIAQNKTGMTLNPEQVQDYVLLYFVTSGFCATLDEFMVSKGYAPNPSSKHKKA